MKPDALFDNYDPEIVGAHGGIGTGKTFLAATISQFWPTDLAARLKGTGKKVALEDVYWFEIDSNATAGFSTIGVEVPKFNLQAVMSREAEWKKYGFTRRPSIIEAMGKFVALLKDRVAKGQTRFAIIDTVTALDGSLIVYHTKIADADTGQAGNKYYKWQLNFAAHQLFHDSLKWSGANLVYCMHSKAVDEDTTSAKKKNQTVLMAGGAQFAPAISGQSAAVYKRDMTMQLLCKVSREPGKKGAGSLVRKIITDVQSDGETKNRYGGILPLEMDPNLRAIYKAVRAAQAKWR